MIRKAQVYGAAVVIPLATEGVGTSLKRGCAVQTTRDSVVLREGENSLRVVDSQAFCAGSIVVRHVVELPANVTMCRTNLDAKYGVAWDTNCKNDSRVSTTACVVNFETGEVATEELPALNEPIRDAFVDSNGKLVAVVGTGTGKLYGRSQWGPDEWKVIHGTELDARAVDVCSCGRSVSSALIGNCFMYLRAHLHSDGSIVIESWKFDLDMGWSIMRSSSRTLGTVTTDIGPAEGIKLFVTDTWKFAILAVGNVTFQFQVDQSLQSNPVKRISMDHRILDGGWLEQNDTFAILLANGQICIAHHGLNRFELLAIETSNTLSKRLSLSALLGKASSAALQLVWIKQEKQVAIDFGTACAVFNLEICNDNSPSISSADSNVLFSTGAFSRGKMRDMPRLVIEPPVQNVTKSPRPGELVNIAQTNLMRSHEMFEGSYFLLLGNIHKKLAADSATTGMSRDPIDCIGENLHLMEVLLSFTLSMDPTILRQIAFRLLSASPQYDRKLNYGKEIAQIMPQVTMSMRGVSELEDWWIESVEVSEFLRSYFAPINELLQASIPIGSRRDKGFVSVLKNISSLCELVADQEIETIPETILKADKGDSAPLDCLKRLLVSYTMVCRCLGVNCVLLDLEHIFAIGNRPLRQEEFCCFLRPGWCKINASAPESCFIPSYIVLATVQYAAKADALNHILTFLLACTSPRVDSYLRDLCKATATIENDADGDCTLAANRLHWLVCEKYISEATAIFRHLGAHRQFKYSHREVKQDTGRLMIPYQFNQEFESFCQTLSTKMSTTAENCRSGTISLWKFAKRDKKLCERLICLISRIAWHLEAANYEISNLFKHSFGMKHFYPELEPLSGNETLCHNIMKIRTAIFGCGNELRLPKFWQSERTHENLPFRTKKIARSLMLVVWGLWIREKAARCTRGALLVKEEPGVVIHASESIGAQAAMCALHLQALRTLNGDNEELLSTQLSLLEEASTMNAHKTATVLAWGFPSHTIFTRHLKRYKSLRQIVQQVSTAGTLEECEQRYQQLQAHTRTGFLHSQGNYEEQIRNGNRNIQIDLLVVCCCDPEFLQVMSVLAKCPHDVVANKAPASFVFSRSENIVHDEPEESTANDAHDLSLTKAGPVPTPLNEGRSESLISRDEVIALLQAQTRHLEDKIHAATIREETRARSTSNEETQHENKVRTNIPILVEAEKVVTELADVQRKSRVYFQVQNLNQHRYSSGSFETGTETIQPSKQFKRHDSVRNALKLFRLRQEIGCYPHSDQAHLVDESSGVTHEDPNISTTAITPNRNDAQSSPTVSTRRDKLSRDSVKQQSSRLQRNSQNKTSLIKEPVFPLRLEYGTANASLKLLGRSSQQRNPSVKRRQFIHQKTEEPQRSRPHQVKAKPTISAFEPANFTTMKTTGAQTNDTTSPLVFPTTEMKERSTQLNEIGPEKTSPVTQECVKVNSVAGFTHEDYSQKGVGIQCHLTEDNFVSNTRRKHGPTPLNIADKYPIWVDLDKASTGSGGERSRLKSRKMFLQVARFGGSDTNNDTVEDEQFFTTPPCVSTVLVTLNRKSEDGGEENQSDSQHSPSIGYAETFEYNAIEQVNDPIAMKYRASYRQHVPVRERSGRMIDDRNGSSGINTLMDLRDNMQQMTQRLRALETCANSIDEEFKVSQKRLSRIGDRHPSSRTKVLNDIADVLESTEDAECQVDGRNSKIGLLSKKASNDLDAAKKLLETIEQLTIGANGQ